MRSTFGWFRPRTLDESLARLAEDPAPVPIAGGTNLMVQMTEGVLRDGELLDLSGLEEMRGIELAADETRLGALTTYTDVVSHGPLAGRHRLLAAAAAVSGGWAIRNRGTLGGNLANGSPTADTPPALLASDARVELASLRGRRWVGLGDFQTGPRRTLRAADELITRIAVPVPPARAVCFYRKVGTRRGQVIGKVCLAARAEIADGRLAGVRIALGGVAPTAVRARQAESCLEGKELGRSDGIDALDALLDEIAPVDDARSTASYRWRVARALLEQFLESCRSALEKSSGS